MTCMDARDLKITTALDYASGTADRTGAVLDMSGYQGVVIAVKLAAVATGGTNSIKAQQATTAAFTTPHDIIGSAQVIADDADNSLLLIDVKAPIERYVRVYVDKDTTNAMAEDAVYIQYGGMNPVANTGIESFYQAVTGTA